VKLPRENPNSKYNIEVDPGRAFGGSFGEKRVKIMIHQGKELKAGLSLTEQETDDLIVMLTYYKNEQFPKAAVDNG